MRLGVPHDDESHHGASVEDPGREGEEVDQGIDGSIEHHGHRDDGLQQTHIILWIKLQIYITSLNLVNQCQGDFW